MGDHAGRLDVVSFIWAYSFCVLLVRMCASTSIHALCTTFGCACYPIANVIFEFLNGMCSLRGVFHFN